MPESSMLIFLSKEMSWYKMERSPKFPAVFLIRMLKSSIAVINFLSLEGSILTHICNYPLWGLTLWMILTLEAKLPSLVARLHSLILPFLLLSKPCLLPIKDGEAGLTLRLTVTIHFMQLLQAGIQKLLDRWKEWWKKESLVLNSSWHTKEFLDWMMFPSIKLSKLQEIWEPCALFMLKMVTLSPKTNKNSWKKESLVLKVITYQDLSLLRPKQSTELLQSHNMQMFLSTSYI